MEHQLQGKVALITGGSSGIGEAVARVLFNCGVKIGIVDINKELGTKLVEEFNKIRPSSSIFIPCDVTDTDSLANAFTTTLKTFSTLDIVFNNAGISSQPYSFPFTSSTSSWKHLLAINLTAVIEGTQIACKIMSRSQGGNGGIIINTASMGGILPMPDSPVYAATKAGVVHFSRSLEYLSDSEGVRVCAVCPSFTVTPLVTKYGDEMVEQLSNMFGGLLKPEDIAQGVLQLIQDQTKSGAVMRITKQGGRDYWPKVHRKASL